MLKITVNSSLTAENEAQLRELYPLIFSSWNPEKFFDKFNYHSQFLILMAYWNDDCVGFKIGYGQDCELFYSWTGGVHPDFRKRGIADALMKKQHEWCRANNYSIVETRTRNKFPEMIQLNFKHDFQIVGTFIDTDQEPKIILRKKIKN